LNPREVVDGWGFGEASIGITAGSGKEGAGETERREENDDRREWLMTLGGFMGKAIDVGVPGAEGTGEPPAAEGVASMAPRIDLWPMSGGAGLCEDIRLGGRSVLIWLAILGGLSSWPLRVYWPSLVLSE
jgi:hypothetical protein